MSKLPRVSGREVVAALSKVGYEVVRQRGSHIRMRHPTNEDRHPATVPDHKEIKTGTLRAILRDAGFSVDQFRELL